MEYLLPMDMSSVKNIGIDQGEVNMAIINGFEISDELHKAMQDYVKRPDTYITIHGLMAHTLRVIFMDYPCSCEICIEFVNIDRR